MIVHHEKPIGVDTFFREIFPGDTVRDQDGKEYTVDERGYAKSLDGVTVTGFNKLKEPVYVSGPDIAGKFQEKDGKVGPAVPVDFPKPAPRVRLAPIAKKFGLTSWEAAKKAEAAGFATFGKGGLIYIEEKDVDDVTALLESPRATTGTSTPEPEPDPKRRGGRENKSGVSQLGNLVIRLGFTVKEAREILTAEGIEVFQHGPRHKASIHAEDLPKVRELLAKVRKDEQRPKPIPKPGNHGNHRPNSSGIVRFNNLARSLKIPTWRLRELATAGGFDIVTGGTRDRNDGINREDEARFREYCAPERPQPVGIAAAFQSLASEREHDNPDPVKLQISPFPPQLSQEELDAIKSKTLGQHIEIRPAMGGFSDQDLAEELRRRGYEVTATKRIEL